MGFTIPKTGGTSFLWSVANLTGQSPLSLLTLNQQTMADARLQVAPGQPLMWNLNAWGKGLARFGERPPEALLAVIRPETTVQLGAGGGASSIAAAGVARRTTFFSRDPLVRFNARLDLLLFTHNRLRNTHRQLETGLRAQQLKTAQKQFTSAFRKKWEWVLQSLETIWNQRAKGPLDLGKAASFWKLLFEEFCPLKEPEDAGLIRLRRNGFKKMFPPVRQAAMVWQKRWLELVKMGASPEMLRAIAELGILVEKNERGPRHQGFQAMKAEIARRKRAERRAEEGASSPIDFSSVTNRELALLLRLTGGNQIGVVKLLEIADRTYGNIRLGRSAVSKRVKGAKPGDPLVQFQRRKKG